MTPAARLTAAASVLDSIAQGRSPAEVVLKAWGQANRYAGSGDRRALAERVYDVLRSRARLVWTMGGREDGRALVIGSLSVLDGLTLEEIEAMHSGDGYGPRPLSKQERARLAAVPGDMPEGVAAGVPEFVVEDFKTTYGDRWFEEAHALMDRAPVDLRVNGALTTVEAVLAELRDAGLQPTRTPWSAWGLRLTADPAPNIPALEVFQSGRVEIQDEGSQLVCWLAGASAGRTVVDYCAGGGGKTVGLAQAMAGQGTLIGCDVVQKRLDNIRPRLARAGVEADLRLLGQNGGGVEDLNGKADLVFVDAPCSGTGAWRRRPEDAWRMKVEEVERMNGLQTRILAQAARLVRPGGRLAYVTCSMLRGENEATMDGFEEDFPGFRPVPIARLLDAPGLTPAARTRLAELADGGTRLRMSPASTGTDGFFFALFERSA